MGLLPVAYTLGNDFKLGPGQPVEELTYWETWEHTATAAASSSRISSECSPRLRLTAAVGSAVEGLRA